MEKGVKIYPFSIEKLSESNARYWFHVMESQLKAQFSWGAIEYYHEIGKDEFSKILRQDVEWFKVNLKADMIIQQGLSPTTILEVKDQWNAGLKWDRLKEIFLKSSNTKKAMKLMKMANWSWNPAMNEREAFRELNQLGEELIDMNGSEMISVKELIVNLSYGPPEVDRREQKENQCLHRRKSHRPCESSEPEAWKYGGYQRVHACFRGYILAV